MRWFSHDTDMHRNRKIRKLIRTHGATGYAFWVILLEKLYAEENGFEIVADSLWLEDMADDLKLGDDRAPIRILDTLADLNLISKQLWAEHVIFAPSIAERGDTYTAKRIYEREKKRKQRAKKEELSLGDIQGTKGQSAVLSPSYTDPDLQIRSTDQINRSDQDQIEESVIFSNHDRASLENSKILEIEPEIPDSENRDNPTSLLNMPEIDDKIEIQARSRKSSGGASAARKTANQEKFDAWWKPYRQMCLIVGASPGNKSEALRQWQKMPQSYESAHFEECDRLYREQCGTQMMQRGQVFGVAHGCRYLRSDKWQEAFDRAELQVQSGVNLSDPNAVKQAAKSLERQRVNDEVRELLAQRGERA